MKRYKPLVDKMFYIISVPTAAILFAVTALAVFEPLTLLIIIPIDLLTLYFIISPLFGYVELREESVFIKFGFFLSKEVPYKSIRGVTSERKIYSDSMISLKNSLEHVNIKFGRFDIYSVSVRGNDDLMLEITSRTSQKPY